MNKNPKTGVAYGYISANVLDPYLTFELMTGVRVKNFRNISEDIAVKEIVEFYRNHVREGGDEWGINRVSDLSDDEIFDMLIEAGYVRPEDYLSLELVVSGVYEGVSYMSSWLGGNLHFFIADSPVITGKAGRAGPCVPTGPNVPGAGILDSLDGDVVAYDVPLHWRADQTVKVW